MPDLTPDDAAAVLREMTAEEMYGMKMASNINDEQSFKQHQHRHSALTTILDERERIHKATPANLEAQFAKGEIDPADVLVLVVRNTELEEERKRDRAEIERLRPLVKAAGDMLTGISVHNSRHAKMESDMIQGPVVTAFRNAHHTALNPQEQEVGDG